MKYADSKKRGTLSDPRVKTAEKDWSPALTRSLAPSGQDWLFKDSGDSTGAGAMGPRANPGCRIGVKSLSSVALSSVRLLEVYLKRPDLML